MLLNLAQAGCHLFCVLVRLEMNMESWLYLSVLHILHIIVSVNQFHKCNYRYIISELHWIVTERLFIKTNTTFSENYNFDEEDCFMIGQILQFLFLHVKLLMHSEPLKMGCKSVVGWHGCRYCIWGRETNEIAVPVYVSCCKKHLLSLRWVTTDILTLFEIFYESDFGKCQFIWLYW
jgi:hypothetical protein